MALSPRRALGPWLEPLAASLWIFFLVWTVLAAAVWIGGIGDAEMLAWTQRLLHLPPAETGSQPSDLQSALLSVLRWIDPLWILLAAANTYAFTALREGLDVARRWSAITLGAVAVIAWLSVKTGWPLGPIYYTGLLAPRFLSVSLSLGPVPVCVPLLWLAALLGARDLALRLRPGLSQVPLAFGTALLVVLFDFALEPLAWKHRVYWLWYPARLPAPASPPLQNYATWFLASALLALALRETRVATAPEPVHRSPAAIYALLLGVFVVTRLVR